MRASIAIAAAALLALTGCAPLGVGRIIEPRGAPGLEGTWRLVDGRDAGGPLDLDASPSITLTIHGDTFSGEGPCNSYRGSVHEGVRAVDFGAVSSTRLACSAPPLSVLESRYFAALEGIGGGGISGDNLSLSGVSGPLTQSRLRLVFEPLD
jgi:heat shock protein HslJ